MKPQFVSAIAMLFCCAIFAIVGFFAYTRYEAAQTENAAFRAQLQSTPQDGQVLGTRMPGQLPAHETTAPAADASPSASPGQ